MKIFVVSRGCPSHQYPMNGIFELDQAIALKHFGNEVVLLGLDMRSFRRKRKWGFEKRKIDGVNVEILNIPCGNLWYPLFYKLGNLAWKILYKAAVAQYGEPDIIHAHFTDIAYIVSNNISSKVKFVITEHSSEFNTDIIKKNRYYIAKKAYEAADKVIAVSNSFCRKLEKNFGISPICIHNIVDSTNFEYYERDKKQIFRFISVGNLNYNKCMSLLIDAFKNLYENNQEVELIIIGDGPEYINLKKQIEKLQLTESVKLMGQQCRKNISEWMHKSDCFILLSESETFGVVYIEAIASGLPVIATQCGGPEDFVNEQNGLLIPTNDLNQTVEAMKEMMKKYFTYDFEKMSDEVKKMFSPAVVAKQLSELYKDI